MQRNIPAIRQSNVVTDNYIMDNTISCGTDHLTQQENGPLQWCDGNDDRDGSNKNSKSHGDGNNDTLTSVVMVKKTILFYYGINDSGACNYKVAFTIQFTQLPLYKIFIYYYI